MKHFKWIIFIYISFLVALSLSAWFLAQSTEAQSHEGYMFERDADIPDLPFIDNPNPLFCGIPEVWKEDKTSWINGSYQGELIQEEVLLYDSHFCEIITGRIESGLEIEILLVQINPSLNYYLVRSIGLEPIQEGWVPEPFVSFDKI